MPNQDSVGPLTMQRKLVIHKFGNRGATDATLTAHKPTVGRAAAGLYASTGASVLVGHHALPAAGVCAVKVTFAAARLPINCVAACCHTEGQPRGA